MITIPQNFQGDDQSLLQPERFRELVKLFNRLETDLQYPNCEGNEDARRILARAQRELSNKGFR